MSDLLDRARKAKAIINDEAFPMARRATSALRSFSGFGLSGLPVDIRSTLESHLADVNRILANYDLETMDDYVKITDDDLSEMLGIIDSMVTQLEELN